MYQIYRGGTVVGQAQIKRKGLYYEITCRCSISDLGRDRIILQCGNLQKDLGVCVPFEGGFGFRTSVPVKSVGEGEISFTVSDSASDKKFIAVCSNEPFYQLSNLRSAYIQCKEGTIGVVISE